MLIVTADIGGTHARFALATIENRRVRDVAPAVTLHTADYASLQAAWETFGEHIGQPLPRAAAIAMAGPVAGDVLKLTNSSWIIRPSQLDAELKLDRSLVINDFAAVSHAVAALGPEDLQHWMGPDRPLPADGVISVIGAGTGLGVAHVVRTHEWVRVVPSEGGHLDYAPTDALEDKILAYLRPRYRRVSTERIVSGPGLLNIYEAIAAIGGQAADLRDDKDVWAAALSGQHPRARDALLRFCLAFGSVAGDLVLAHGAQALVIAGGLAEKLHDRLPTSGFHERFTAKGRFEPLMAAIPIKRLTYPEPGLYGAAAAFALMR